MKHPLPTQQTSLSRRWKLRTFTTTTCALALALGYSGLAPNADARPRFGGGSAEATGPHGGTVEAKGARFGRGRAGTVKATGPNGNTVTRSGAAWTGYRRGYIYRAGAYHPATITVNSVYVAPVGVYSGWRVVARPVYVAHPAFATYPVEVAVQVQLKNLGYYAGPIDGDIGDGSIAAIHRYQIDHGLAPTGTITHALLKSLNIT